MSEKTAKLLPIVPSRNTVLYPGRTLPLKAKRRVTRSALALAREGDASVIFLAQNNPKASAKPDDFFRIGTLAQVQKKRGGDYMLHGLERVRILRIERSSEGAWVADYEILPDTYEGHEEGLMVLVDELKKLSIDILDLIPADTKEFRDQLDSVEDPTLLMHLVAENLESSITDKQSILEIPQIRERALLLIDRMQRAKESLSLQAEIRQRLAQKMSIAQKENILREHMRAIQEELGEGDSQAKLRRKVEALAMPKESMEQVLEELDKLDAMGKQSPEYHMLRTYIELITQLPWQRSEQAPIDIAEARQILDADHYGLDKVKRRIVEHLAVLKLRGRIGSTILLFVGPPGVGKTSLGRSIAKALHRSFVRVSLGGVRDDAEIRGHRRTYIGALPGQIIQGLKRAGKSNPVFLLDEIDKLGKGFTGDPASALLEVLDSELNHRFVDHYIDMPFDLSDVLFICTANSMDSIPAALRDRLEIIELSSYTSEEKYHIAQSHLLPTQVTEHGLKPEQFTLTPPALRKLISHYTREAGVRDLNRRLAAITRHAAQKVVEGSKKIAIGNKELQSVLGQPSFDPEDSAQELPPGVVTGLAWTPVGGEILFVEARLMPGSGKLTLTGKLGEVMKESAQIALSLIRSKFPKLMPGFKEEDLHIHVPSGAIPKDGPSAGIALFTAIASLLTEQSVSPKIAMTGEITLRGVVMPVGGVKEKLLAAHRAGIETIILCKKNMKDLDDVPKDILKDLKIVPIEDVTELLDATLDIIKAPDLPRLQEYTPLN